jgi:hypothetical protein
MLKSTAASTPPSSAPLVRRRRPVIDLVLVLRLIVASLAILALGWGLSVTPARADGDPASDVLATESLFLAQDANVSARQQVELGDLLSNAGRSGYPIRVALIASAIDLGSVTELWRQPQSYADFLGQELSLVYNGPLLVVMPNGFGLYHAGGAPARAALGSLPEPGGATGIGAFAVTAVQRLASAAGHPLPAPSVSAPSASASSDPTAWIAFSVGAALVALAWAASFRAKPLRLPGRVARGG